jgi:hypothetical protein
LGEDIGFCVLRVKARGQRELITVVGHGTDFVAGLERLLNRLKGDPAAYADDQNVCHRSSPLLISDKATPPQKLPARSTIRWKLSSAEL